MAEYFKKSIGSFLISVLFILGCSKLENISKIDYYPLETGNSIEYLVNETQYSVTEPAIESIYYTKEIIGSVVNTISDSPIYEILRFKKTNIDDKWSLDSIWTCYRLNDRHVKVENNIPYIKLMLPHFEGQSWNGNALNSFQKAIYKVSFISKGLEVVHYNDSSAVELNRSREIYQGGIGMIFKEVIAYKYCQSSPDCIGKGIISSGKSIVYTAQ